MTPFIQYNWTVLFLDLPVAAHVVNLKLPNTHFTESFLKSLPSDVFYLARRQKRQKNWINFPSKIPTAEQLFCITARWVLLPSSNRQNFEDSGKVLAVSVS